MLIHVRTYHQPMPAGPAAPAAAPTTAPATAPPTTKRPFGGGPGYDEPPELPGFGADDIFPDFPGVPLI